MRWDITLMTTKHADRNCNCAHCKACHRAQGAHSSKGECATAVSGDTRKCAPQCLRAGSAHLLHMHNCPTVKIP